MIDLQKQFQADFQNKLEVFLQEFSFYSQTSQEIYQQLQKVLLSKKSKRLRPFLTTIGFQLSHLPDSKDQQNLLSLGLALELFQVYCLIHDDIIDNSPLRRGVKTIHTSFSEKYKNQLKGISAGILAGDLASSLADVSFSRIQSSNFQALAELYGRMKLELMDGQIDDVFDTADKDLNQLTEDQILRMIDNKSGRYSIQKPLLLGATLAGVDAGELAKIQDLGQKMGLIFQLVDDLLGVFGKTEATGKPDISDILEGKKTLLMLYTFQACSKEEKRLVKKVLGNPKATLYEVQSLKDLIKKTGADAKIKEKCKKIHSQVLEILNQLQTEKPAKEYLKKFSGYLLERGV